MNVHRWHRGKKRRGGGGGGMFLSRIQFLAQEMLGNIKTQVYKTWAFYSTRSVFIYFLIIPVFTYNFGPVFMSINQGAQSNLALRKDFDPEKNQAAILKMPILKVNTFLE